MKMHTYDDEEFKDTRVTDEINTRNEFKKNGRKDKGLKSSSDNPDADEVSKSNMRMD